MVLEPNRALRAAIDVAREDAVAGLTHDGGVVLDDHSVLKDRDVRGGFKSPVFEPRRVKDDVINLPLAGVAGRIHQRRVLAVNRSCLTICSPSDRCLRFG